MAGEVTGWEAAYRNRPTEGYGSSDSRHEDCDRLDRLFHEHDVARVLDLGCGDGRHLVYFAKRGYHMYGLDIAPTAIRLAAEWLTKEDLSATLVSSDMTSVPWRDNFFNATICFQVINHHRIQGIRQTIGEIYRTLRPDGFLYLTVRTSRSGPGSRDVNRIEIEPNTFVPLEGPEKGVPHHEFDMEELRTEFAQFNIREDELPIHEDSKGYTCVLWQKPVKARPAGPGQRGGQWG